MDIYKTLFLRRKSCIEYITENTPSVIAVSALAWFTVPTILSIAGWVPYIGAGYYMYTNTCRINRGYTWYRKVQNFLSN